MQSSLDPLGLLDASPHPCLVLDRATRVLDANRAFLAAADRPAPEVLGRRLAEILPADPAAVAEVVASCARALAAGQPDAVERLAVLLPRPGGGGAEERCWDLRHAPLADQGGEAAVVLHATDVTELSQVARGARRDRAALRDSEERLSALADNLPVAVVYQVETSLDLSERRFTYVSATSDRLLGVTAAEALADPRVWLGRVHPEDLPRVLAAEREAARSMGALDVVVRYERPDGRAVVGRVVAKPRAQGDGRLLWDGLLLDITEAAEAEAALRASEGRFRAALEIETVGAIYLDMDGRLTGANEAFLRLSGYGREEIEAGRLTWRGFTPPEWRPASERAWAELLATGRTTPYEKEYIRKDGSRWWALFAAKLLPDGTGFELVLDVTDRKRAEARREALARLADRLRDLEDPDAIAFTAAELLGEVLGPSRVGYATIDHDAETLHPARDWTAPGVDPLPSSLRLRDFGSFVDDLKAGTLVVVADVGADARTTDAAALEAYAARSIINVPVIERGRLVAVLYVNDARVRSWRPDDVTFVQDVAERTRTAVERARNAAALRASEVRYRALFEALDAGFTVIEVIFDEEGRPCDYRFVENNPAFERQTGLANAVGRRIRELDPAHEQHWFDIYGRVARTGESVQLEEGSASLGRWWSLHAFRVGEPGQNRVAVLFNDITPRRRAELALRELNDTLEAQVAQRTAERDRVWRLSRDLLVVVDANGVLRAVNPAWTAVLGHAPEEVEGRSFLDVIWPEDAGLSQGALDDAVAARDLTNFENRFRHKDGTPRWISWHTSAEGGLVYAYGRDVTAEKERQARLEAAEAAQREADALYRAYFQNTAEALFVVRVLPDGGFALEELNPAHEAATGLSTARLKGLRLEEQLPAEVARAVAARYRQAVDQVQAVSYREVLDLPAGRRHWDTVLVPVVGDGRQVLRIVGSARDITAQVMAEEQLRQSQKMEAMGNLTGGVAHDFNNLLTPILGVLDRLHTRGGGTERDRRLIDGALQSAERARTLVHRLLAFARRQPLQPAAVDVAELVRGMADLVASTTGPQIHVQVDIETGLPAALADANQLEMAILNLAVNARDAMPHGGMLRIAAGRAVVGGPRHPSGAAPGAYVRLVVTDTGTGMDEATLARAVEPFFSTKGVGRGTGLGLSMVHGLAAQLGGTLSIRSRLGRGTDVDLWLPVAQTAPDAAAIEPPSRSLAVPHDEGRILLVDDEVEVRASTADMLAELGYHVTEAGSADEALRLMDGGFAPDLLVTDHLMPGLTGTEFAQVARRRQPGLPVLVVSGYAEGWDLAPDLPRLTKPFRQAELAAGVARARAGA